METKNLVDTVLTVLKGEKSSSTSIIGSITFFAGTFRPWHQGHQACVQLHCQKFPDIPLLVLPDRSPWKNELSTSLTEMQNSLQHFTNCWLSDLFLKSDAVNPTYRWVTLLKEKLPLLEIRLLMGTDVFLTMDKWLQIQSLLPMLAALEIVPRTFTHATSITEQQKKLQLLAPQLKFLWHERHDFENLSSTQIRDKV